MAWTGRFGVNLLDMAELGLDNLRRTKLRTALTVLGVVIGIGALTSMVSFGTGMQKNITDALKRSDLFTSLFVTATDIDLAAVARGDPDDIRGALTEPSVRLTDSLMAVIREIPGVEITFAQIAFPVKIRLGDHETRTTLQALPASMGAYPPFSQLAFGEFFSNDSVPSAVVRWETLQRMNLRIADAETGISLNREDSLGGVLVVPADSILGRPLEVVTAVLDVSRIPLGPLGAMLGSDGGPFKESSTELVIDGILSKSSSFVENRFGGGVFVPMRVGQRIPHLGFSTVWDLLGRDDRGYAYDMLYVRATDIKGTQAIRDSLQNMGLNVSSVWDQLKEIRRGFLIVDSILGAIGTIALVVAALGIVNTMVMSILERTREIGIMKAIGGSEGEIRIIFFVEAGAIGVVGAIFGLVLGWLVTRIANLVVNSRLMPVGETPVNLFYFPLWLILGAVAFSVLVSLVAGLYPASRAARVDPVRALRHD